MPRRLLGIFMLLLVSVSDIRAQGDAVLFTVGTESVGRDEFEFHFNKSLNRRADVFVQTYACFKQKVQLAKELGVDTLDYFRDLKESYRKTFASRMSQEKKQMASSREWIRVAHITYPLHQRANKILEADAKRRMDSLSVVLKQGGEVSVEWLPWTQKRFLLNEWQNQLERLKKDEYSAPFFSPLGLHIIVWTDKYVVSGLQENETEDECGFLCKEMDEALLVASLERYWGQTVSCSEYELQAYFEKNKEQYGWGIPHYQGAVIHCRDKKHAKQIKKYLKQYPESLWMEAYERMPDELSDGCKMEVGLFAIGSNPYVDKLVFKCGTFEPLESYPHTWVMGKKMKRGPKVYTDICEKVSVDCLNQKKKTEMEAKLQKFAVEINDEVLKTVNHGGI